MHDWVTKDLGWKLFSLFLALAIWLTVHKIYEEPGSAPEPAAGNTRIFENLPVLAVSTAQDARDFGIAPLTVRVIVSGSAEDMARLQTNQVRAIVDLTGVESGLDWHRPVGVSAPPGVTLVGVDPSQVLVFPPSNDKK
jgi:YbbR domain-containing protein